MLIQALLELDDLQRISRGDQRLTEQVVGIEGNRRHQRVELVSRDLRGALRSCGGGRPAKQGRISRQQQHGAQQSDQVPEDLSRGLEWSNHTSTSCPSAISTKTLRLIAYGHLPGAPARKISSQVESRRLQVP